MPQMSPAMLMTVFIFGGILVAIVATKAGVPNLLKWAWKKLTAAFRVAGELLLGVIAVILFVFFPGSIFSKDEEEDYYQPREPLAIPHGAIAAAIATRWRHRKTVETYAELASAFAHASAGGSAAAQH